MKHIKTYEDLKGGVKIGDYILFGSEKPKWDIPRTSYHKYLQTHIGKLFDYNPKFNTIYIEFDELPTDIDVLPLFYNGKTGKRYNGNVQMDSSRKRDPNKYYAYAENKILYHSPNKDDIQVAIDAKKFNI